RMALRDLFRLPLLTRNGLARERFRYQEGKPTVADEDFIRSSFADLTNATDQKLIIVLRHIVADMCGISAQILRDHDLTYELDKLMGFAGFDLTLFIQLFEDKLDVGLDDSFRGGFPPAFEACSRTRTLGKWIREMLPWVKSRMR